MLESLVEFGGAAARTALDAIGRLDRGGLGRAAAELAGTLRDSPPLMRAIWRNLTVNERRMARALAVTTTPLYGEETTVAVGIKSASIGRALESLANNADIRPGRAVNLASRIPCGPTDATRKRRNFT